MSVNNRQQIAPEKPKVLAEERIFVYVPIANDKDKGIASFEIKDFKAPLGHVKLQWPMDMMVERLADPTLRPSLTKVLPDEFEKSLVVTKLINPVTGVEYESSTAEIKLNRKNRNALVRPDLVMLGSDFVAQVVNGPNGELYNSYNIKRSSPLTTPSLVQVDVNDFLYQGGLVKVNWPLAHNPALGSSRANPYGMVKIKAGDGLKFDVENNLQVDIDVLKANTSIKPSYTVENEDFIDISTGLAKRDDDGNTLIEITKAAVGLGLVENRTFASREYSEFGTNMKAYFQSEFDAKLNKSLWDGVNGLFRDWDAPSEEKNTVQKWLESLQASDASLQSSINALGSFLGFFNTSGELIAAHVPSEELSGKTAFVLGTSSYWAIRFNVVWEWYNTESELSFTSLMELDANNVKVNGLAPSVGSSGKWVSSDHIHPSDPTKVSTDLLIQVRTEAPTLNDFRIDLQGGDLNIPYVKTGKYLHNWKKNTGVFTQDETTDEAFWAGSLEEFDNAILDDLPNGAIIVVDDDEYFEPGELVTVEVMDMIGITVPDPDSEFTHQFVVVDNTRALYGVPVTVTVEPAIEGRGERRRVVALPIDPVVGSQDLAVVVDSANGSTIGKLSLASKRLLKTDDESGKVTNSDLNPYNMINTGLGDTIVELESDRIIMSDVGNTVKIWSSGIVANRPIGSDGLEGLSVILLDAERLVKTDGDGGLSNVAWLESNLIKTDNGEVSIVLTEDVVVLAGINNTVKSWESGGSENALVVRGAQPGTIKVRTSTVANKILMTGLNGTIQEIPLGSDGQMLVSAGENSPGWIDIPEAFEHLPQTVLTVNPTEEAAVAFKGLVAVFAQPLVENMRSNCIYYY